MPFLQSQAVAPNVFDPKTKAPAIRVGKFKGDVDEVVFDLMAKVLALNIELVVLEQGRASDKEAAMCRLRVQKKMYKVSLELRLAANAARQPPQVASQACTYKNTNFRELLLQIAASSEEEEQVLTEAQMRSASAIS